MMLDAFKLNLKVVSEWNFLTNLLMKSVWIYNEQLMLCHCSNFLSMTQRTLCSSVGETIEPINIFSLDELQGSWTIGAYEKGTN